MGLNRPKLPKVAKENIEAVNWLDECLFFFSFSLYRVTFHEINLYSFLKEKKRKEKKKLSM